MTDDNRAPVKKVSEAEFQLTESVQASYTAMPQVGTTREDVLKPAFWVHVAKYLKPMTEIRVLPKDGSWYGRYLVLYVDSIQARVKELEFHVLEEVAEAQDDSGPYAIKWSGPAAKFRIVRKADGKILKEGFGTRGEAAAWMFANTKAIAA